MSPQFPPQRYLVKLVQLAVLAFCMSMIMAFSVVADYEASSHIISNHKTLNHKILNHDATRAPVDVFDVVGGGYQHAPAALLAKKKPAPIVLGFDDMYVDRTTLELSDTLTAAAGQTVYFRGYAAPPLEPDADYFVLTRYPMAVCPFCETEAEWPPDIVYVKLPPKGTDTIIFGGLGVTGTLEVGIAKDPDTGFVSKVRILADTVERAN